ncbi:MAG TPA: condensation domain-containing protein [Coleofasciculaceae cyanobacterium]
MATINERLERLKKLSPEKRTLILKALRSQAAPTEECNHIPRRSQKSPVALSFAQQGLWLLEQLQPGSIAYNMSVALRLVGSLNVAALEQTLNEIVRRHEVFRTSFTVVEGQPVQVIAPSVTLKLPVMNLGELPNASQSLKVQQLITEWSQQPFDLAQDSLLRGMLLQLAKQEHLLLLSTHHIVCDGWSLGVFIRELVTLYTAFSQGKPSPLPELPIQYADFAIWQRQWLQGEVLETQLAYWKRQLGTRACFQPFRSPLAPLKKGRNDCLKVPPSKGDLGGSSNLDDVKSSLHTPSISPVQPLTIEQSRSSTPSSAGKKHSFALPSTLTEALKTLSQREGITLFMTLLAAFKTLLYCYSQQEDIAVGSPIANRNRRETEELIGFFVNTLVLRTDLSGNPSFRDLLRRVREVALGAYAHQDLPFEKLVAELQPDRNLGQTSLYQVWFVLQNTPMPAVELPGLILSLSPIETGAVRHDLKLDLTETPKGLQGFFEYKTDLFEASAIGFAGAPWAIARIARFYETLLSTVVQQPDIQLNTLLAALENAEKQQKLSQEEEFKTARRQKLGNIRRKPVKS